MRPLRLRAQLVVVAGLFLVYTAGVGMASWLQVRAHARLEARFHESLTVLANLPRLRDRLRRVDQATAQYLMTGQRSWLDRREESLEDVRALTGGIGAGVGEQGRALLDEMDRELTAYLAETSQYIAQRRAGGMTPAEAARVARSGWSLESTVEPLSRLGESHVAQLRDQRQALVRVSRWTSLLVVLAGAGAAAFVWLFLSRYLTGPVDALRHEARGWTLGREWVFPPPAASPEVADLAQAMSDMARRLNAQYEREAQFGRLKASLVSMASHEFNNALSVLGGVASLLKATEPAPPAGRRAEYYAVIESNLRALGLATSNLLDLGRLEDGRFAVRPRRADLARVFADAAQALRPLYERKELDFRLDLPERPLDVLGDPEALPLVVTNLLGNAIKYTPEKGRVTAGLRAEDGGRARVYVEDTGIGIAPQDRERVLAGHRTQEGRKAAQGFGLGLTLVKRILDAHGAALEIDGGPGRGSRFSFTLPLWAGPGDDLS